MKTKIYGASDDLIEIEGAINDEANHYDAKNVKITCSDGTTAVISYNGNWMITVKKTGHLFEKIVLGNPAEEPHTDEYAKGLPPYSDVLVLDKGIDWVKIGRKKFK